MHFFTLGNFKPAQISYDPTIKPQQVFLKHLDALLPDQTQGYIELRALTRATIKNPLLGVRITRAYDNNNEIQVDLPRGKQSLKKFAQTVANHELLKLA
ncbi:MAG: hypothetical protein VKJ06_00155 [Vampirovibrionales bacterium]|nr:hypothetical protein [Vampirovibrionales bacterium]